jgi:hypothetical protein
VKGIEVAVRSPALALAHSINRATSPCLIRSPSVCIQRLGSSRHARRRSPDFQYNALSYARNFDEGGTDGEGEEEAGLSARDALKHRCFASRLPTLPPPESPSTQGWRESIRTQVI